MGYTVLHRLTDVDDAWKANGMRGGWHRTYAIKGLKPYKNYSVRTMPYSFQAAGLTGPTIIGETKEDGKSTFYHSVFAFCFFATSQPTKQLTKSLTDRPNGQLPSWMTN